MAVRAGRLALTAAALTCTAALAGCASSASSQPGASGSTTAAASPTAPGTASSSGSTPAVTSPSAAAAGPPACPTSSLQVKVGVSQGYAGGVYVVIDFTSTGASTCTLYGYPGVSLVSGPPYTQIGLAAKRSTTTPRKLATLAAGPTATALLQIQEARN